jgi:hypothetical protein
LMLKDENEKVPIKKRQKKTWVNWVNPQLKSWDRDNLIESKPK